MSEAVPGQAAPAVTAKRAELGRLEAQAWRYTGRILLGLAVAFVLAWVAYKAVGDGRVFVLVGLNALTLGGLYFLVASGFSLIFGLMRVVNMAHGSFFMLGGFLAFELVQRFATGTTGFSPEVDFGGWILAFVIASLSIGLIGLLMQQLFLRWNQGQELRQALITIAASIIIADQVLGHFGGIAEEIPAPSGFPESVDIGVYGLSYPFFRIFVLAVAVVTGLALYGMIKRTRLGMVIRAGVDDEQMTSALGINIQKTFAIAFVVGSALAALGAVVWASQSNISSGQDGQWLLNSLVVVIVGGMGSIFGAAAGALLFAFVANFGASYLPTTGSDCCTQYSNILTFVLIALVLSFRPRGLFGRPG